MGLTEREWTELYNHIRPVNHDAASFRRIVVNGNADVLKAFEVKKIFTFVRDALYSNGRVADGHRLAQAGTRKKDMATGIMEALQRTSPSRPAGGSGHQQQQQNTEASRVYSTYQAPSSSAEAIGPAGLAAIKAGSGITHQPTAAAPLAPPQKHSSYEEDGRHLQAALRKVRQGGNYKPHTSASGPSSYNPQLNVKSSETHEQRHHHIGSNATSSFVRPETTPQHDTSRLYRQRYELPETVARGIDNQLDCGRYSPLNVPVAVVRKTIVYSGPHVSTFDIPHDLHAKIVQRKYRLVMFPATESLMPYHWPKGSEMHSSVNNQLVTMPFKRSWPARNIPLFKSYLFCDITSFVDRNRCKQRVTFDISIAGYKCHVIFAVTEHVEPSRVAQTHLRRCLEISHFVEDYEKSQGENEDGVAVGSESIAVKCPVSLVPMVIPARGVNCSHLQCVELEALLRCCTSAAAWNCPVCDAAIPPLHGIVIDNKLMETLEQMKDSTARTLAQKDGKWVVTEHEAPVRGDSGAGTPTGRPGGSPLSHAASSGTLGGDRKRHREVVDDLPSPPGTPERIRKQGSASSPIVL